MDEDKGERKAYTDTTPMMDFLRHFDQLRGFSGESGEDHVTTLGS